MPTTINIEYSKAVNITTGETWITIKSGNTVLEGENPIEAFKKILEDNNACHHLAAQPQTVQKKETIGTDEDVVAAIENCKTEFELNTYRLMAAKNKSISSAFEKKYASLKNI